MTAPPPGFWHGSWATGPAPATTGGTERTSGWDVLLVSLAGVVLVTTWRVQDLFPILATVQFPLVAAAAAYGTYFLDRGRLRTLSGIRHPVTTLAIVLFVLMMASVPWSVYPGLSFRFIFNDHIKTLLMMLLIAASIRRVTDVQRLANVLVVGASLYSFVVLTSVKVGESGRLGELWYYDANDLGMLLAATLPLMIYAVRPGVSLTRRLLGLVGICLAMLTIVKTGSRGGFLALLACGAYLLFGFQAIPKRVRVASVALVAVLFVALANDHYWDMMGTLLHPTQDYNWTGKNEVGRMEIWKRGIGYMLGRPLVGVGANAFPVAEGTISPLAGRQAIGIGLKWSAAHNSFVQIGAEIGVGGLLVFLAMLYRAGRTLWRIGQLGRGSRGARPEPALAQVLTATLIGYCVGGFFLSQAYSPFLYAVLGIVVGLAKVTRPWAMMAAAAPVAPRGRVV